MNLMTESAQADYLFKLGERQFAGGDFESASATLKSASARFLQTSQYQKYLRSQNYLMVLYTEMENWAEAGRLRQETAQCAQAQNIEDPIFYYTLGMCSRRKGEYEIAEKYFNQGFALAVQAEKATQNHHNIFKLLTAKINMCFISYGLADLFYKKNLSIAEAVQELNNMEELLKQARRLESSLKSMPDGLEGLDAQSLKNLNLDLEKLDLSCCVLKANLLRKDGRHKEAESLYWFAFERSQKSSDKQYLSPYLFYCMGFNYMEQKEYDQAGIFLNLAQKTALPNCFKKLGRNINQALKKLKEHTVGYDMVVNFHSKLIVEKQKGNVNFKNQFILLDLLKLFVTTPGTVHSKESLVEKVWKQKYDPCTHDNKIYVTINRLRTLVEPQDSHPKYIFRRREGYYMNETARILLK